MVLGFWKNFSKKIKKKFAETKKCSKFALAKQNNSDVRQTWNGPWCNGNTTVFGAVFLGSSPSGPTKSPDLIGTFFMR